MSDTFDFGGALTALKEGKRVQRGGWNAHHVLGLQRPDKHSANSLPYIYMVVGDDAIDMSGARVPWVASQTDLLAEDWQVASDTPPPSNEGGTGVSAHRDVPTGMPSSGSHVGATPVAG